MTKEQEIKKAMDVMHKEIPNLNDYFTDERIENVLKGFDKINLDTVSNDFVDAMLEEPIRRCDCCGCLMVEGWYDEALGYDCSDECAAKRRGMTDEEFKRYRIYKPEVEEAAEEDEKNLEDLTQEEVEKYIEYVFEHCDSCYTQWY